MKTKLLQTLLFLLPILMFSQSTEYYYFDANWKPVSSNSNYSYFRVIYYDKNGTVLIPIKDYYKTGKIQGEFYSDVVNSNGMKYGGTSKEMGMNNGRNVIVQDGYLYKEYYTNGKFTNQTKEVYNNSLADFSFPSSMVAKSSNNQSLSNSSNSSSSTPSSSYNSGGSNIAAGTAVASAVVVGAALYGLYKWATGGDDSSGNSSSASSSYSSSIKACEMDAEERYPKYRSKIVGDWTKGFGDENKSANFEFEDPASSVVFKGRLFYDDYKKLYYVSSGHRYHYTSYENAL